MTLLAWTGAKKREEIYEAFETIYPVLQQFRKGDVQPPPMPPQPAPLVSALTPHIMEQQRVGCLTQQRSSKEKRCRQHLPGQCGRESSNCCPWKIRPFHSKHGHCGGRAWVLSMGKPCRLWLPQPPSRAAWGCLPSIWQSVDLLQPEEGRGEGLQAQRLTSARA